jgi:hypothetical protein
MLSSCIPALLFSERLESDALEARDLGFEEAKIHERLSPVVLTFDVFDVGTVDQEDRDAAAVRASDQDVAQLTATQKPIGPEKQVICLKHASPPLDGESRSQLRWVRSR